MWTSVVILAVTLFVVWYVVGQSSDAIMDVPDLEPNEMATHVLRQSQEGRVPAYWVLKHNFLRPKQLRNKKHVAIAFMTNDMMKRDQCEIRYFDGYHTIIGVDEISKGKIVPPTMIMKQWVLCEPGFRDLTGKLHEN